MIALMLVLALAGAPVTVTPTQPAVGDLITVSLPEHPGAAIRLDASSQFEVVASKGSQVIIRTFRPKPLQISGEILEDGATSRFGPIEIQIRSVLSAGDRLQPAPLKPPIPPPRDLRPWWWVGGAAVLALAAWAAAALLSRRPEPADASIAALGAADEFLAEIRRIRSGSRGERGVIALGDATRRFFARVNAGYSRARTSEELFAEVRRAGLPPETIEVIEEILSEADLAKFSPWGSRSHDAAALADRAVGLARLDEAPGEIA